MPRFKTFHTPSFCLQSHIERRRYPVGCRHSDCRALAHCSAVIPSSRLSSKDGQHPVDTQISTTRLVVPSTAGTRNSNKGTQQCRLESPSWEVLGVYLTLSWRQSWHCLAETRRGALDSSADGSLDFLRGWTIVQYQYNMNLTSTKVFRPLLSFSTD